MVDTCFLEVNKDLSLRPVVGGDIEGDYFQWLNDSEVTQYLETGRFPNSAVAMQQYLDSKKNRNNLFLAIVLKKINRHIGCVMLGPIHWIHRRADIGLLIGDKKCWGKGYAKAVMRTVISHAFDNLNLNKISLTVVERNTSAIRLYEGLGFKREGSLRKHFLWAGSELDVFVYAITKSIYFKSRVYHA